MSQAAGYLWRWCALSSHWRGPSWIDWQDNVILCDYLSLSLKEPCSDTTTQWCLNKMSRVRVDITDRQSAPHLPWGPERTRRCQGHSWSGATSRTVSVCTSHCYLCQWRPMSTCKTGNYKVMRDRWKTGKERERTRSSMVFCVHLKKATLRHCQTGKRNYTHSSFF